LKFNINKYDRVFLSVENVPGDFVENPEGERTVHDTERIG
jgi:hypothetical protein